MPISRRPRGTGRNSATEVLPTGPHEPNATHGNGYKVDVAHNSCIDHYIKKNFTYLGLRGDGYPQWRSGSGNVHCDEGTHRDITFY